MSETDTTTDTPAATPAEAATATTTHTTISIEQPPAPVATTWKVLLASWLCFLLPIPFLGLVGSILSFAGLILAIMVLIRGETKPGVIQLVCWALVTPIAWAAGWGILFLIASATAG